MKTWTRDAILDAIRAWYSTHGSAPTCLTWARAGRGHPNRETVRREFGSMAAACWAAGVPAAKPGFDPYWTRPRCLLALRVWRMRHGRWPTQADWERAGEGRPTWKTVQHRCGGWRLALRQAGMVTAPTAHERRQTTRLLAREQQRAYRAKVAA